MKREPSGVQIVIIMSEELSLPTGLIPLLNKGNTNYINPQTRPASKGSGVPAMVRFMLSQDNALYVLPTSSPITIGRNSASGNVSLDLTPHQAADLGISRQHMQLEGFGDRFMAKDLGSVNGSMLNSKPMVPGNVYEVYHGDELQLGRLRIRLFFVYN